MKNNNIVCILWKLHVGLGGHTIDSSPDQVLNLAFRVRPFNGHSTSAPAHLGLLEVKLDNVLDSLELFHTKLSRETRYT